MAEHVDWFNFMSYDIHGVWDGMTDLEKKTRTGMNEANNPSR